MPKMQDYERLELEFGQWVECPSEWMVACSSGTAALHLALEALALPFGTQVLIPEFTMIACARAVTLAGMKPVFVDCGDDLLMNLDLVPSLITEKTKVIMPVHIYGRICNIERTQRLAERHNLFVVEDCCEAHGAPSLLEFRGASAMCWSFYRNKIVAGEEGGMVAFNSDSLALLARSLRSLGFTDAHDFLHIPRGHNYRLSNLHAAAILRSLNNAEENIERRTEIASWYDSLLPPSMRMPRREVCWVYDLLLPDCLADKQTLIVEQLNQLGVAARHGFKPMSQQVEYRTGESYAGTNAYRLSKRIIYLPVYPSMTYQDVVYSANQLIRLVVSERR